MPPTSPTTGGYLYDIAEAVQPLRPHDEFVESLLSVLGDALGNDMLSYNEIPEQTGHHAPEDITALMQASKVVWTPAVPMASLSVDDQRELSFRYAHEHPSVRRGQRTVYRISELLSQIDWHRTSLYNQLHRPLGLRAQCLMHLPALPGRMLGLAYNREYGDFSDRDLRWLARIRATLSQRFRDHWRYLTIVRECAHWRRLSESEERAVAFVDARGQPVWISRCAQSLLSTYGLSPTRGLLPEALRAWLRPVLSGQAATVPPFQRAAPDPTVGGTLTVSYHPDDGGVASAMLCLAQRDSPPPSADVPLDPPRATRALTQALPLTPRQAEVALWMSQGKSNHDIASLLGITPGTVKVHAANIYDRLGVSNRTSVASTVYEIIGAQG